MQKIILLELLGI